MKEENSTNAMEIPHPLHAFIKFIEAEPDENVGRIINMPCDWDRTSIISSVMIGLLRGDEPTYKFLAKFSGTEKSWEIRYKDYWNSYFNKYRSSFSVAIESLVDKFLNEFKELTEKKKSDES